MALRYGPHSPSHNGVEGKQVRVLLVEPDGVLAEAIQRHLSERFSNVDVTQSGTLASSRAYLSGNAFDAVVVTDELPDGSGLDLLDLRAALELESCFFVRATGGVGEVAVNAGATACFTVSAEHEGLDGLASQMSSALDMAEKSEKDVDQARVPEISTESVSAMLEELREETGAMVHAINNPLTVITGNAQFLLEVARAEQTDSPIVGPIEDINAATEQLAVGLARLSALRERIAHALGTDDRIAD